MTLNFDIQIKAFERERKIMGKCKYCRNECGLWFYICRYCERNLKKAEEERSNKYWRTKILPINEE